MALITCSECGAEISDKATQCPKCGCPLEVTKKIIKDGKSKNSKKIFISIVISIVIIASIVGVMQVVGNSRAKSGLYNNIEWGTSMEDVAKIAEKNEDAVATFKKLVNEEEFRVNDCIIDFMGFEGLKALVHYDCSNNKTLKAVNIMILNSEKLDCSDEEIVEKITEEFNGLYGECEKDFLGYEWETAKSIIKMSYVMDGLIMIDYKDINNVDKE